ncbi:MAG: hypothetical protein Q7T18_12395 [Sedimentisphaerales bacterium]|nr:hypothetical protein [Sedimentisphaerales bacterium]
MEARKQHTSFYCAAIFLLAFVGVVQGWEFRLVPETLRFKVNLDLGPYWDGVLTIEEVAIDPAGSVAVRNLTLNDRAGRNWLSIRSAKCVYGYDQNNLTLKEVSIERPQITLWFDKDTLNLPLHYTSSQNAPASSSSLANIQRLVVNDATLTITGENFNAAWDGLSLAAAQTDEHSNYAVKLTRQLPNSTIDAHGVVNTSTEDVNVDVTARHTLGADETAAIFTLLGVPILHDVNGQLKASVRFAGNLNDSTTVWPVGYAVIKNGVLNGSGGPLIENLKTRFTFLGQNLMAFDTIEGSAMNGRFHGTGFLAVRRDNSVWFGGHIAAQNIDLARYSQATGHVGFLTKGRVSVRYDFTATNRRVDDHKGQGVIFLDDADLWKMPVVSHLFKFIDTPLTYSDGVAYFKTVGPTIIFEQAQITSPITAIEFQKDSYVNVQTEFVDGHAVFVPIKKLRAIEEMIPFFKVFLNLRDTLTRVSFRGYWSEPSSKLIHKDVLRDVGTSTINFFTDTAQSGGQIGTDIVDRLQPLWATPTSSDLTFEATGGQ